MEQVVESTKELGAKVWESFSYFMNEIGQVYTKIAWSPLILVCRPIYCSSTKKVNYQICKTYQN